MVVNLLQHNNNFFSVFLFNFIYTNWNMAALSMVSYFLFSYSMAYNKFILSNCSLCIFFGFRFNFIKYNNQLKSIENSDVRLSQGNFVVLILKLYSLCLRFLMFLYILCLRYTVFYIIKVLRIQICTKVTLHNENFT